MQAAPSFFSSIPSGLAGTKATLKVMVDIARAVLKPNDPTKTQILLNLRTLATQLVQGCPEKDWWCEANKLQTFVRDSIRYVRDMRTAELIQFPDQTLTRRSGDCDDKALLLVTLAETIGFNGRFCAIGVQQREDFSHVMAQLLVPGRGWVNAETIPIDDHGGKAILGWFPPDATCVMLAHV